MLDLSIIFVYLTINLIMRIRARRNTTAKTEVPGLRGNYTPTMMVATTCATLVAAENVIYGSQRVFEIGIIYTVVALGIPLASLFNAYWIVPYFASIPHKKCLSVGELMGSFYGENAKLITGISSTIFCIGSVGAQVCAIRYFCDYFLGLQPLLGVLLGAAIITIYSTFGGIKSVTIADIAQLGVLVVIIPITASIGVQIFGWKALFSQIPGDHLALAIPPGHSTFEYISLFIIFSMPGLGPPTIQRFLMSKDIQQMKDFMKVTGVLGIFSLFCVTMIGLTVLAIAPETASQNVFPYFVNQILPTGLRGFAIAGMLAVIMSTADSFLNAGRVCLVNDVLQPVLSYSLSANKQLKASGYSTLFIGLGSVFAALTHRNIMEVILIFCNFWMPVVTVPLYLTLWGFKGTSRGFIAASLSGLVTAVGWMFVNRSFGFEGLIPAMLVNLIVFIVISKLDSKKNQPSSLFASRSFSESIFM